MKYFPKNAKTKKFSKKKSAKIKTTPSLPPANLAEGFDFRQEFELMIKELYKGLSPEVTKKIWLLASSIIMKNTGSPQDLRLQLHTAIQQAHQSLKK